MMVYDRDNSSRTIDELAIDSLVLEILMNTYIDMWVYGTECNK